VGRVEEGEWAGVCGGRRGDDGREDGEKGLRGRRGGGEYGGATMLAMSKGGRLPRRGGHEELLGLQAGQES
jgi:hypothetical protein